MRSMRVYTPPGYETGNKKYPVLYLLHGSGDDDEGWSTIGRAGFILDNLLAASQAVPMIVVMPNGSMPRTPGPAASGNQLDQFTAELLDNIMPVVEKHYRGGEPRESRHRRTFYGWRSDPPRRTGASGPVCLHRSVQCWNARRTA